MAGTVTATEKTYANVKKLSFSWSSDSAGDATKTTSETYNGRVLALLTDPDGDDAPTDNYDVVINDSDSHDILLGAGADRDEANTEYVTESSLGAVSDSVLSLSVSNAGSGKAGVVAIWIR